MKWKGARARREVARWLEAEERGWHERADLDCRAAFSMLERPHPSQGFALRVAAAVGLPSVREAELLAGWWARAAVAIIAALAGGSALAVLLNLAAADLSPVLGLLPEMATAAFGQVSSWTATLFGLVRVIVQLGEAARTVITTPPLVLLLAATASVGGASLYAMARLIASRQEYERC